MGIFKKLLVVAVIIGAVIMAGLFLTSGGLGKIGFDGGTVYITTTVVGTNGERLVLEKQAPLTQSIVYQGVEVASFEYAVEVEFDGSSDVEIGASSIRSRLNCDVSCIVLKEWGIPAQTLQPGRHEIASVSISAADIEVVAPSNSFQLRFEINLQWRPVEPGESFRFLDIQYPTIDLQLSSGGEDGGNGYDPPICQGGMTMCIIMGDVDTQPVILEG